MKCIVHFNFLRYQNHLLFQTLETKPQAVYFFYHNPIEMDDEIKFPVCNAVRVYRYVNIYYYVL